MFPAIIGAAVGLGASYLSSKSSKKAASKAADATLQASRENSDLARSMYASNTANMTPFMASGQRANALLDSLLHGTPPAPSAAYGAASYGAPSTPALGIPASGVTPYDNGYGTGYGAEPDYFRGMGDGRQNDFITANSGGMGTMQYGAPVQPNALQPGAFGGAPLTAGGTPNALSGFDAFRGSSGFQFRLSEGLRALNHGYAGRGMLESGAAMKGINNYAQNMASNEFGNYAQMLQQQQQLGFGGASALAGVGQNMVNNVTSNNMSAADARANAALMGGAANNSFLNALAGTSGTFASMFGSSYGKK